MTEIRKWDFGGAIPTGAPKTQRKKANTDKSDEPKSNYYPRRRARLNVIPGSDELARMIDQALNALSKGVFWDRGSIINIVL